jgi:hypothetical protein
MSMDKYGRYWSDYDLTEMELIILTMDALFSLSTLYGFNFRCGLVIYVDGKKIQPDIAIFDKEKELIGIIEVKAKASSVDIAYKQVWNYAHKLDAVVAVTICGSIEADAADSILMEHIDVTKYAVDSHAYNGTYDDVTINAISSLDDREQYKT